MHFFEDAVNLLSLGFIHCKVLTVQLIISVNTGVVGLCTRLLRYLLPSRSDVRDTIVVDCLDVGR